MATTKAKPRERKPAKPARRKKLNTSSARKPSESDMQPRGRYLRRDLRAEG